MSETEFPPCVVKGSNMEVSLLEAYTAEFMDKIDQELPSTLRFNVLGFMAVSLFVDSADTNERKVVMETFERWIDCMRCSIKDSLDNRERAAND